MAKSTARIGFVAFMVKIIEEKIKGDGENGSNIIQ